MKLSLKTIIAIAFVALVAPAHAQTIQDSASESLKALQDFQPSSQGFNNQSGGLNINELIHRANLANGRSPQQFQEDQDNSFNDAVQAFRKQQKVKTNLELVKP